MSHRPRDPNVILRELRQRQPPRTPEEVRDQWNLIEQLIASITPDDEIQFAILETLQQIVDQAQAGGGVSGDGLQEVIALLRQQVRGQIDTTALPIGQTGQILEDVQAGNQGTALFETWAGDVLAAVQANEDVTDGDRVVVVQDGNVVDPAESVEKVLTGGGERDFSLDRDLDAVDISNSQTETVGPVDVSGAADVNVAATSGANMNVSVEWLADDGVTVLFTEAPAGLQGVTTVNSTFEVLSEDVQILFTDASGGQNTVTGTVYTV